MTKIAFLFPGQGAQTVGMGKDIYENYESARRVFDTANKILGKSVSEMCFEGPEEDLKQTINTQPCIVTASIAILEALRSELNIKPDFTAGHSLGEYCAMYTAGVMDLDTTLKLIQNRANLMSEAKGGSMAAILNAGEDVLKAGLEEGSKVGYVDVANYNSPVQVVITGDEAAVKTAGDYILANGARRVVPLPVSGAFHSKFMQEAGAIFKEIVEDADLNDTSIPVITNVDAIPTVSAEDFRAKMPKQIYSSVHWTQTIQKMVEEGVNIFIEIGPGKILAGLNKKITPDSKMYNIYDKASLDEVVNELRQQHTAV